MTSRQEMFCREYMLDLNATQAAIRAGYSKKTASRIGPELLGKPCVASRVAELKRERAEKLELDAAWVLRRLKDISDRAMQCEPVLKWDHTQKAMVETGDYQFDSQGANRATELIGKHLGMFKDKVEMTGKDGEPLKVVFGIPRPNKDAGT